MLTCKMRYIIRKQRKTYDTEEKVYKISIVFGDMCSLVQILSLVRIYYGLIMSHPCALYVIVQCTRTNINTSLITVQLHWSLYSFTGHCTASLVIVQLHWSLCYITFFDTDICVYTSFNSKLYFIAPVLTSCSS